MRSTLICLSVGLLAWSCSVTDEQRKWSELPYPLLLNTKSINGYDIVLLNRNRSESQLTEGGSNLDPEWSPDGNKIAYWTSVLGGLDEIFVMNEDGSGKRNLTNSATWYEERPVWSPGGSMIAYDMLRTEYGIGVMQSDGSNQKFVVKGERYNNITWDHDGATVMFNKRKGSNFQIFSVGVDGSNELQLTGDTTRSFSNPSISPEGQYLAFLENDPGVSSQIIMRNRITGAEINISQNGFGMRWSSDAYWMYFGEKNNAGTAMYRIRPDGSSKQNISRKPIGRNYSDLIQSISPDGGAVAFLSDRTGQSLLYVMNSDGTDQQLVFDRPIVSHPQWRPR